MSNIVKVRILSSAPKWAALRAAQIVWGVSAAGSASDWQSGGHEFEPRTLHQKKKAQRLAITRIAAAESLFLSVLTSSFLKSFKGV